LHQLHARYKGLIMDPIKVSAQFAAFVWFTQGKEPNPPVAQEAWRYTQDNWLGFLPEAHPGLGELLMKIAQPTAAARSRRLPRAKSLARSLAAAS
jgi:hypothetical protein